MNKDHYFSDITELFLKAKKEEVIEIDPHLKSAVREMVKYKINEMGGPIRSGIRERLKLWKQWRYQLIGVPASLVALIVIVYAATNLKFSIPKEDFTPEVITVKTGGTTEMVEAPAESVGTSDEAAEIAEEIAEEKDRAVFRTSTRPKTTKDTNPLVLDINDMGRKITESRSLNDKPEPVQTVNPDIQPEENIPVSPEPDYMPDYEDVLDDVTFVVPKDEYSESLDDEPEDDSDVNKEPETEEQPDESEESSTPPEDSTDAEEPSPSQNESEPDSQPEPVEPESGQPEDQVEPATAEAPTLPDVEDSTPVADAPPVDISDQQPIAKTYSTMAVLDSNLSLRAQYAEQENFFLRKEAISSARLPVYYFIDTKLVDEPSFDKELLEKITSTKPFSSISVYLAEDNKVVVEVTSDMSSKWYLFEKIGESWTIQKYEKELFEGVVK